MNWTDILVIAIVLGFFLYGYGSGLLLSIFRFVSLILSIILTFKFYPVMTNFLAKTFVYTFLKSAVSAGMAIQPLATVQAVGQQAAGTIISELGLPLFLKQQIAGVLPNVANLINTSAILDVLSGSVALVILKILSIVVMFAIVSFLLQIVKIVIVIISKLPIIGQINRLGGAAFGLVEGIVIAHIVLAAFAIFAVADITHAVNASVVAKYIYNYNIILQLIMHG